MERTYAEYAARQAMELLAIDSPTGFTARAADWVQRAFEELGYTARRTAKGGVLVDLGGRGEGLLLEAHADTLGGMVAEVKSIPVAGGCWREPSSCATPPSMSTASTAIPSAPLTAARWCWTRT